MNVRALAIGFVAILLTIAICLAAAIPLLSTWRKQTLNEAVSDSRSKWLDRNSDNLDAVAQALLNDTCSAEQRSTAARALYTILNDYTTPQSSVSEADKATFVELQQELHAIGWPDSEQPKTPGRVIISPHR